MNNRRQGTSLFKWLALVFAIIFTFYYLMMMDVTPPRATGLAVIAGALYIVFAMLHGQDAREK